MKFKLDAADSNILNVSCLKDLGIEWNGDSSSWIEIKTLEELMEFGAIFGRLIIYPSDERDLLPHIRIYNDYIE